MTTFYTEKVERNKNINFHLFTLAYKELWKDIHGEGIGVQTGPKGWKEDLILFGSWLMWLYYLSKNKELKYFK